MQINLRLDVLRALLRCASNDENLYNLCGVHVAVKSGTLRMTATDASVLAAVTSPIEPALTGLEQGVIVKRVAIEQILKVAGKKTVSAALDTERKTLSADSFEIADVVANSTFPDVWKLIPSEESAEPGTYPTFDLRNVAKFDGLALLRYAAGATKKDLCVPTLALVPCGLLKPILVRIEGRPGETIAGVISPCKGPAQ